MKTTTTHRHHGCRTMIRSFWCYWLKVGMVAFAILWGATALIEHYARHHGHHSHKAPHHGASPVHDADAWQQHRRGARFHL